MGEGGVGVMNKVERMECGGSPGKGGRGELCHSILLFI